MSGLLVNLLRGASASGTNGAGGHSGIYYSTPISSPSTTAPAADTLSVSPILLSACSLDRIGVEVTAGAANSLCRLGIYTDDKGYPGALLLDAGTVSGASIAVLEITIDQAIGGGLYWLAYKAEVGAPTVRANAGVPGIFHFSATAAGVSASGNARQGWLKAAQAAGSLPVAFPASPSETNGAVARVFVRGK